jgi:hypothetical protein
MPDPIPAAPSVSANGDLRAHLLRALGVALALVLPVAAVVGAGLLALGVVPAAALGFYAGGVAAAGLACMGALWLHGRFLDPRASAPFARDGRLLGARLQSLLAAAFGVKLAVLVLAFLVLRQTGVKFADTATFAITFAGGSLLCQMATAMVLARAVQRGSGHAASTQPSPGGRNP